VFVIQKITQRYDPAQDRIEFNVQDAEGRVLRLWLTQRLANRLPAPLVSWLDEDAGNTAASGLHAWEQAAAQAQLKPDRPVEAVAANEVLVTEIDLAHGTGAYSLVLKWQDGAARLSLGATELRQWLGILYRLVAGAGWPTQFWPAWLAPDAVTASGAPAAAFH